MLPRSFAVRLIAVLLLCGIPFVAVFSVAGCAHHAEADTQASGHPTRSAAATPESIASAAHVVVPASQQDGVFPPGKEWTPDERVISAMEQEIGTLFTHPDSRLKGLLTRDDKPPLTAPFPLSEYNERHEIARCPTTAPERTRAMRRFPHVTVADGIRPQPW